MSIYAVSYDLRQPIRNYDDLYDAIRKYTHCHMMESYWYVDSDNSATEIRDNLTQQIDDDDQLMVHKVVKNWAALQKCKCTTWLKSDSRSW